MRLDIRLKLGILFTALSFIAVGVSAQTIDSLSVNKPKNYSFNLLISCNSLINQMNNPDKSGLFYSSVPAELQVRYKKHYFGLFYLRNAKSNQTFVNSVKTVDDVIRYRFHVSYSQELVKTGKWSAQLGAAYYFQRRDTASIMFTSLENPYKNWVETEHGIGVFMRLGYKLNKFLAVYLESQFYVGRSYYKYDLNYPLTPSQNRKGSFKETRFHALLPSNLYLRLSID